MKRIGFRLRIRVDRLEEYRQRHKEVWPEMRQALERAGWHNYSLFLHPDGELFGYVEVKEDFALALARMEQEEVNQHWQNFMAGFFEIPDGLRADQAMQELEEVFHLD